MSNTENNLKDRFLRAVVLGESGACVIDIGTRNQSDDDSSVKEDEVCYRV